MGLFKSLFGPPSRAKFARQVMAGLRQAGEKRPIQFDEENFRLVFAADQAMFLGNVYNEHCQLPRSKRRAHVKMLADVREDKGELPADYADAAPNIRPKIYCRATFELLRLERRVQGLPFVDAPLYPVGEHLLSTVVYDLPNSIRTLSREDLEKWGVSYYEALERAIQNLAESTLAFAKMGESLVSSVTGDNYDSARLLLVDQLKSFNLKGDLVAVVPQRDELLVTGRDDELGLTMLADLTTKTMSEPVRHQSPLPLRLVDGEWEDWEVPRNHSAYGKFHALRQQFLGDLYAQQQPLLVKLFEKENIEIFPASYSGVQDKETGAVRTYCSWGEGLVSLLPQTDLIVLIGGDGKMAASGEFERVREIVGDLLQEEEEHYPVRLRTTGFPSADQLTAIGHAL